jgi:diamine N-acetyltransferase
MLVKGERLTLRRAQPEDAGRAYEWFALSDLTSRAMGPPLYPELPVPARSGFDARYPAFLFAPGYPYDGRALVISAGDEDVGLLVYGRVRLEPGWVELEQWLAEKRFSGRGYGSEALSLGCRWLHEALGVDRFVVRASRRNVRALRSFRRAGFRAPAGDARQATSALGLAPHPLADSETLLLERAPPPVVLQDADGRGVVFLEAKVSAASEPALVSIGAAASDATAFYCEIQGWPKARASALTLESVAPLLDGDAVPIKVAAQAFGAWLRARSAAQPVAVVSTSAWGRWALAELLGGEELPPGVDWQRVPLPPEQLDAVAAGLGLRRHHALDEARALRHALLRHDGE